MKKILVLSDSHGEVARMYSAFQEVHPDMVIHLGDCWEDARRLKQKLGDLPVECVPGNCDYIYEQEVRDILIEGKRVMICHGHTFRVKAGYLNLELAAKEREADVALFGHTHKVYYETSNGITYLNPGSIGAPPYGIPPSYGILMIDGETGDVTYDVKFWE